MLGVLGKKCPPKDQARADLNPCLLQLTCNTYLHLLYPQSRQKSQPLACSNWPWHSGQTPIMFDMIAPVIFVAAVPVSCCLLTARAESGLPVRRRLVIMTHSATACSGEVNRRSLNQTACVPVTLFKLYATSPPWNQPGGFSKPGNPSRRRLEQG